MTDQTQRRQTNAIINEAISTRIRRCRTLLSIESLLCRCIETAEFIVVKLGHATQSLSTNYMLSVEVGCVQWKSRLRSISVLAKRQHARRSR